jgi:hypothetical protein
LEEIIRDLENTLWPKQAQPSSEKPTGGVLASGEVSLGDTEKPAASLSQKEGEI